MGKPMSTVYVPDEYGRLVPTQVPTWIGFIGWYAGPEPPGGYLYCDGSAIGRETYSELYDAIGTLYGAGDGAETFNLPDARGVFFRGDGGENNAAMGVRQGDAIRNMTGIVGFGTERIFNVASGVFEGKLPTTSNPGGINTGATGDPNNPQYVAAIFNVSRVVPTADENRPINMALKPCIRYV